MNKMILNCVLICGIIFLIASSLVDEVDCKQTTRRYLLNKPQCNEKNMHKIELVVAKAMAIGPNGRKLPENVQQLKTFCKETSKLVSQVEAFFKDCYQKVVRNYATIILYTIKSNLRKYCGKKVHRIVKDLLTIAPCANKYIQPQNKCSQKFINQTSQLINIRDDQKKIPHACCYFMETLTCSEDLMNSIPCMRAHVQQLMDMYRAGSASHIENLCGDYGDQSSDACQQLGQPPKPLKPNRTRYITFVFLLIDFIESFQGEFVGPNF